MHACAYIHHSIMYNTHNWCIATDICKNICRMILTDVYTGSRTLAVVDSVYTTAVAGSKNKRFNPARYAGALRDAKRGGVDSDAQAAAGRYEAERALWHEAHMGTFRDKWAAEMRARRARILAGDSDEERQ